MGVWVCAETEGRMARRRSSRKQARRRGRQEGAGWEKIIPYALVGGLAAIIAGALFFVTLSSSGSASHPDGYETPTLGEEDAPVEFVLWEDFQCTFCRRFETTNFPELRSYVDSGDVRFVWRNFEHYGNNSVRAAIAAYCAGEQDPAKFWEYKDALFANQGDGYSDDNLRRHAGTVGLDLDEHETCIMERGEFYREAMEADKSQGIDMGVTGTPTFFVNGERVGGAQTTEAYEAYITNALAQLED